MRKVVLCLVLSLTVTGAFARDDRPMSWGVTEGVAFENRQAHSEGDSSYNPGTTGSEEVDAKATALTLGLFLDARYLEICTSVLAQVGDFQMDWNGTYPGPSKLDSRLINVNFRILAKVPVTWNGLTVFPAVGPEYSLNVSSNPDVISTDEQRSELTNWLIDAGVGIDLPLPDRYYIRFLGLYGVNLNPLNHQVKKMFGPTYRDYGSRLSFAVGLGYQP